jgi:hypothetical protein
MLMDASNDLHRAISHVDEALDYLDTYPFLQEDNPFLKRGLTVDKAELETLADQVWRRAKQL